MQKNLDYTINIVHDRRTYAISSAIRYTKGERRIFNEKLEVMETLCSFFPGINIFICRYGS